MLRGLHNIKARFTHLGLRTPHICKKILGFLILVTILLLIYEPAIHGEFFFDDRPYLIENPQFQLPDALRQIWFTFNFPDYWPISYTMFFAKIKIFGTKDPYYYHVVNIILHALNCFILWRILVLIRYRYAFFAALFFAVHPLATESVAWIFQARTTLCTLFAFASVWLAIAYEFSLDNQNKIQATSHQLQLGSSESRARIFRFKSVAFWPSIWLYIGALLCFVMSLLAKPATAPLPAFLFLTGLLFGRLSWQSYLWRITPFLLAAMASAYLTYIHQNAGRPSLAIEISLIEKLIRAWDIYIFYVSKVVMPINLRLMYPRLESQLTLSVVSAIFVSLLIATLIRKILSSHDKNARFGLWLIFASVIMLLPALGLFRSSYSEFADVADRYAYLVLPLAAIMVTRPIVCLANYRSLRLVYSWSLIATLSLCCYATWSYAHRFQTAMGAWNFVLEHRPDAAIGWYSRGRLRVEKQDYQGAISDLVQAMKLKPNYQQAILTFAIVKAMLGEMEQAMPLFLQSYELAPNGAHARENVIAAWRRWIQLALERNGAAAGLAATHEGINWAKRVGFTQLAAELESRAAEFSTLLPSSQ